MGIPGISTKGVINASCKALGGLRRLLAPERGGIQWETFYRKVSGQAEKSGHLLEKHPQSRLLGRRAAFYSGLSDDWLTLYLLRNHSNGTGAAGEKLVQELDRLIRELHEALDFLSRSGPLGEKDLRKVLAWLKFREETIYHATLPALAKGASELERRLSIAAGLVPIVREAALKPALITAANRTAGRAYAPYSKFHVGAAVWADGKIFTGCNLENANYSLTLHAEHLAIADAIKAGRKPTAIAIVTPSNPPNVPLGHRMPCGSCRQVMTELMDEEAMVFVDGAGTYSLKGLLPNAFRL